MPLHVTTDRVFTEDKVCGIDCSKCQTCDVYLIADKKGSIRTELKEWFPSSQLRT